MPKEPGAVRTLRVLLGAIVGILITMARPDPVSAQTASYPCQASPAAKEALNTLSAPDDAGLSWEQRRGIQSASLRALLDQHPDDLFVHRRYQDHLRDPFGIYADTVIKEYQDLLEKHPEHPVYMYLMARLLIGRRTNEAQSYLEKILQKAPDFPWAHLALVDVYQVPTYRDRQKAQTHLERFMTLCPSSMEAYSHLQNMEDLSFVRQHTTRLRARLDAGDDPTLVSYYRTLWRQEFRLRPHAEHDPVRQQIREDLARLRRLHRVKNLAWLQTLKEGYKMANDIEGARWVSEQLLESLPHSGAALSELWEQWNAANPRPQKNDPPEKHKAYFQALLKVTKEWLRRWPEVPSMWLTQFSAAEFLKDLPAREVETIAEGLLNALQQSQGGGLHSSPPMSMQVASLYVKRNMRLDRVPDLVEEGFREVEDRAARDEQIDRYPPKVRNESRQEVLEGYWIGWPIMLEAYLKNRQSDKAREVLFQMETALNRNKPDDAAADPRPRAHARYQASYWEWAARLAEWENRKLDALIMFQNAVWARSDDTTKNPWVSGEPPLEKAQRLWKELGGTSEGWQAWLTRQATVTAGSSKTSEGAWEEMATPLPDFALTDWQGRTWRLDDLKGKVALINVWATWCGPCRLELPHLQKLRERLQERKDLTVVTLNIDYDLSQVEPFLKKNGYTFPTLLGRLYVENLVPLLHIPRTWIVGPDGTIRRESVGFNPENSRWLEETIEAMETVRRRIK